MRRGMKRPLIRRSATGFSEVCVNGDHAGCGVLLRGAFLCSPALSSVCKGDAGSFRIVRGK